MVEMWSSIPYNASLVESVDMIVNPKNEKQVKHYLSCSGMPPVVVEDDLQRAIDEENQVEISDFSRLPLGKNTLSMLSMSSSAFFYSRLPKKYLLTLCSPCTKAWHHLC